MDCDSLLIRALEPAGGCRVFQRALGEDPMELEHCLGRERGTDALAHELQSAVVIEDHPLAAILRLPARAK
jgi:hypothetical protein